MGVGSGSRPCRRDQVTWLVDATRSGGVPQRREAHEIRRLVRRYLPLAVLIGAQVLIIVLFPSTSPGQGCLGASSSTGGEHCRRLLGNGRDR